MKRKILLAGVAFWGLIFLLLLGTLLWTLAGGESPRLPLLRTLSWGAGETVLIREASFPIDQLNAFSVEGRAESIRVTLVSGDQITVRQYGDPDRDGPFTDHSSSSGGGASLSVAVPRPGWFSQWGPGGDKRLEIDWPISFAGTIDLRTASGEILFPEGFEGRDLSLSTVSGRIELGASSVAGLSLHSASGSITLEDVTASGDISIQAVSGHVTAGTLTAEGRTNIGSASGSLRIGALYGQTYDIESISGRIDIETALSGGGWLHSASGSVSASGVALTGALSVETISGHVTLNMAPEQHFDMTLSSISGGIGGNAPFSFSSGLQHKAAGSVGDGGPMLSVSTASGGITLNIQD